MAIYSNKTEGVQDLAASSADKVLHNQANRTAITGFSIFNESGANAAVDIYESPDNTSASGTKRATYTIADDESVDIIEFIGQGMKADIRIIAVVTTGGLVAGDLNSKITYTEYTGSS